MCVCGGGGVSVLSPASPFPGSPNVYVSLLESSRMATLIFVDKENGEPGSRVAPKDALKLGSGLGKCSVLRSEAQVWALSEGWAGPGDDWSPCLPASLSVWDV